MSEPKHTPGPWHVVRGRSLLPHVRNFEGIYVMDAPPRSAKAHAAIRQMKDAALIASAPDLLAALQAIAAGNWNFGNIEPGLTVTEFAARAVAKATGGSE